MIQSDTQDTGKPDSKSAHAPAQIIHVSGSQSLRTAATLRASLLQALEGEGALEIDLNGIDDADVGTLQLLIAAERSALEGGRQLRFVADINSAFVRLLAAAGASGLASIETSEGAAARSLHKGVAP